MDAIRKSLPVLLAALAALSPSRATADARTRGSYPSFVADRPITLPPIMGQLSFELGLTHVDRGDVGLAVAFGGDVGLQRRVSIGAYLAAPVYPGPDFGRFDVNVQLALLRQLAFRFDVGAVRASVRGASGTSVRLDGFSTGLSLPWRARLHRMVSLYGWRPDARAAGLHPVYVAGSTRIYGAGLYGDLLLQVSVHDDPDPGDRVTVWGSFFVPIGITVQPIAPISFGARTGYRLGFSASGGTVVLAHYVPLYLDLTFHIFNLVDLGFTASFQGSVAANSTFVANDRWGDLRQVDLWVAGRF